jgi:hypothetical protein
LFRSPENSSRPWLSFSSLPPNGLEKFGEFFNSRCLAADEGLLCGRQSQNAGGKKTEETRPVRLVSLPNRFRIKEET